MARIDTTTTVTQIPTFNRDPYHLQSGEEEKRNADLPDSLETTVARLLRQKYLKSEDNGWRGNSGIPSLDLPDAPKASLQNIQDIQGVIEQIQDDPQMLNQLDLAMEKIFNGDPSFEDTKNLLGSQPAAPHQPPADNPTADQPPEDNVDTMRRAYALLNQIYAVLMTQFQTNINMNLKFAQEGLKDSQDAANKRLVGAGWKLGLSLFGSVASLGMTGASLHMNIKNRPTENVEELAENRQGKRRQPEVEPKSPHASNDEAATAERAEGRQVQEKEAKKRDDESKRNLEQNRQNTATDEAQQQRRRDGDKVTAQEAKSQDLKENNKKIEDQRAYRQELAHQIGNLAHVPGTIGNSTGEFTAAYYNSQADQLTAMAQMNKTMEDTYSKYDQRLDQNITTIIEAKQKLVETENQTKQAIMRQG